MTNSMTCHYLPSSSSGTCVLCASPFSASAVRYEKKQINKVNTSKYWYVLQKDKTMYCKLNYFVENKSTSFAFCSYDLASVEIETILSNQQLSYREFCIQVKAPNKFKLMTTPRPFIMLAPSIIFVFIFFLVSIK